VRILPGISGGGTVSDFSILLGCLFLAASSFVHVYNERVYESTLGRELYLWFKVSERNMADYSQCHMNMKRSL
jgi:hypothetical protein